MASVGLEPHLVHDTSLLFLSLDHLLVVSVVESLVQLIHLNLFFSSLYNYHIRQILSDKMATVGLEPHLVHDTSLLSLRLDYLLAVGSLAQLIHLNVFSLAYVINIRHNLSHKMASVGLEPYLVHITSLLSLPLDHLLAVGRLAQFILLNLVSLAPIIQPKNISCDA